MRDAMSDPKVMIGIATSRRPHILRETIAELEKQTFRAAKILICYADDSDISEIDEKTRRDNNIELLKGRLGLPAQRNRIIDHADGFDLLIFFDDDFFAHRDFIAEMVSAFRSDPNILCATGKVIADGAQGPGLTAPQADRLLAAVPETHSHVVRDTFNTYGCNMAFRVDALQRLGMRFDERLPLYAWYEDMDFSRRFLPHGRVVKVLGALGVHLGTKNGKNSGLLLGYSQIANPLYLARKGTYPWSHALRSAARHTAINLVRSFAPEPWIDRRGRTRGNWLAIGDLVRGKIAPERVLALRAKNANTPAPEKAPPGSPSNTPAK